MKFCVEPEALLQVAPGESVKVGARLPTVAEDKTGQAMAVPLMMAGSPGNPKVSMSLAADGPNVSELLAHDSPAELTARKVK